MMNKAAIVGTIAAVGMVAVIGTIAAVTMSKRATGSGTNGAPMSESLKLSTLCTGTRYPDRCTQGLSQLVNETANPEDIILAAFRLALDEVAGAYNRSKHVWEGASDGMSKAAGSDCKKLLDDATGQLTRMAGLAGGEVVEQVQDLRLWVSAVWTYIFTCSDQFDRPELRKGMEKELRNSTEVTSVALSLLTRVGEVLLLDLGGHRVLAQEDLDAYYHRMLTTDVIGTYEDLDHHHRKLTTDVIGTYEDLDHHGGHHHRKLTTDVIGTYEDLDHHHRKLTTDVIGTYEDLDHRHHQRPRMTLSEEEELPEWATADERDRALSEEEELPAWAPEDARVLLQSGVGSEQSPNAVVAKDGSGDFKTIGEAVKAAPSNSQTRFVIHVKAGDYSEYVDIGQDKTNIFMYGDGPTSTRVIGSKSWTQQITTMQTATFSVSGSGFLCKSMAFVNTAGPERHQAVALHVQGDFTAFYNCRFEAYQDTLYVHAGKQFFRNCEVLGTVDFIFGNALALFQNCAITVRKPMPSQQNMVTANERADADMPSGIVLQGCRIAPDPALAPARLQVATYLGRPWKPYALTVVMETDIGDLVRPEGWAEWSGTAGISTLYYAEYANTGAGADTSKRVKWPGYHVIGRPEATKFTAGVIIDGAKWIQQTGIPNVLGFIK